MTLIRANLKRPCRSCGKRNTRPHMHFCMVCAAIARAARLNAGLPEVYRCSYCLELGHNRAGCELRLMDAKNKVRSMTR